MKRFILTIISIAMVCFAQAGRLFLAPDSIYYVPYANGTASVSGSLVKSDTLIIPTHVMIPDSCLAGSGSEATPDRMRSYRVTLIGEGAFLGKQYSTIILPDSLEQIDAIAFQSCSRLKNINLPPTLKKIQYLAFFACTSLQEIRLPDAVVSVGIQAFARCTALKYAEIGNGLDTVPNYMFASCSKLETVELGNRISVVETSAFSRCSNLKHISIYAKTPPVVKDKAFQYLIPSTILLSVPCLSNIAYLAAQVWKDFQIEQVNRYTLTADVDSSCTDYGSIDIVHSPSDCNDYYAELNAVPNEDYVFVKWSNNTTNPHYAFNLSSDTVLYAYFALKIDAIRYDTITLCANELPFSWIDADTILTAQGTYSTILPQPTYRGGDSIVQLQLNVNPSSLTLDADTMICAGEQIEWHGKLLSQTGLYYDTMMNVYGCDSIQYIKLSTIEPPTNYDQVFICDNEQVVFFNDTIVSTIGHYERTYTSFLGCDSIVVLDVVASEPYQLNLIIQNYRDNLLVDEQFGSVSVERYGYCSNTVMLTPIPFPNATLDHWLLNGVRYAAHGAFGFQLDSDTEVVAAFVYNTTNALEQQIADEAVINVYDMGGRLIAANISASELTSVINKHGMYLITSAHKVYKIVY